MHLKLKDADEDGVGFARMPDGTVCNCQATNALNLRIGAHREKIALNVVTLEDHEVIMGQGWLKQHNPTMHWQDGRAVMTRGDRQITLYPSASGRSSGVQVAGLGRMPPLSAMQFSKPVKRGGQPFVAILRPLEGGHDEGSPHLPSDGATQTDQGPRLATAGGHVGSRQDASTKREMHPPARDASKPVAPKGKVQPRNTRTAGLQAAASRRSARRSCSCAAILPRCVPGCATCGAAARTRGKTMQLNWSQVLLHHLDQPIACLFKNSRSCKGSCMSMLRMGGFGRVCHPTGHQSSL